MHGVSRRALSEEELEAKRKSRQKKLEKFVPARDLIFKKLRECEYDNEGLQVAGTLLRANPDFYIFWNYRKSALKSMFDQKSDGSADGDAKIDYIALFKEELRLTEECLRENPKSYGSWYHRKWLLGNYSSIFGPKKEDLFKKELQLCAESLRLDERNFHCWDYRRFIRSLTQVDETDELEFSDQKINENFSNYSAWHYRSSLLPGLFPSPFSSRLPLEELKLRGEMSLVQNAVFVDPEDQSAWFYNSWLLRPSDASAAAGVKVQYFHIDREATPPRVILSFDQAIRIDLQSFRMLIDEVPMECEAYENPDRSRSSRIWMANFASSNAAISDTRRPIVKLMLNDQILAEFLLDQSFEWFDPCLAVIDQLQPQLPEAVRASLQQQLENCASLKSLEQSSTTANKWPTITEILALRALDICANKSEIDSRLQTLITVDPKRRQFYDDFRSVVAFSARLVGCYRGSESTRQLSVIDADLTTLPSMQTLLLIVNVRHLDLSRNRLTSVKALRTLVNLTDVILDENQLCDTNGLGGLRRLSILSLRSNRFGPDCKGLTPLISCSNLRSLNLSNNLLNEHETDKSIIAFLEHSELAVIL